MPSSCWPCGISKRIAEALWSRGTAFGSPCLTVVASDFCAVRPAAGTTSVGCLRDHGTLDYYDCRPTTAGLGPHEFEDLRRFFRFEIAVCLHWKIEPLEFLDGLDRIEHYLRVASRGPEATNIWSTSGLRRVDGRGPHHLHLCRAQRPAWSPPGSGCAMLRPGPSRVKGDMHRCATAFGRP